MPTNIQEIFGQIDIYVFDQILRGNIAPGMRILDAGCGMGRNSFWPMRYGASKGTAIDVDPRSLDSARKTLAAYPNVTVREQSVYDLEPSATFDIAFSIGVIHHLQEPLRAVKAMMGAVKPGLRVATKCGYCSIRQSNQSWVPTPAASNASIGVGTSARLDFAWRRLNHFASGNPRAWGRT